jgi:hypothetical protein
MKRKLLKFNFALCKNKMNEKDIKKLTKKELIAFYEEQLKIAKSENKNKKKEFSECFCSKDKREFIKYKNLSETKKFFEENFCLLLKEKIKTADKKITSEEFHNMLVLK